MFAMKPPQDFKIIADRVMKGEKVLISCPANEKSVNLAVITEQEYNIIEKMRKEDRKKALLEFKKTVKEIQEQSVKNGTDNMSMDEINEIIAESRNEKRYKECKKLL